MLVDVQHTGRESGTITIDLSDGHAVCERRDVEHVEQSGLGWPDFRAGHHDLDIGHDFNGTTSNLGGDRKGLEEGGLARLHASVSSWNDDIDRRDSTSTGGSLDLVSGDDVTDFLEVARGEDEADVAPDMREETLVLGVLGENVSECTSDHGVLSHQNDALATKSRTDLVHLIRTDVVDIDDENRCYER